MHQNDPLNLRTTNVNAILNQTLDNRELSNKREIMMRKSSYTIQNGFGEEEDDRMGFVQWLWRILLVLFTLGLIGVGVAVMTLGMLTPVSID